MLSYTISQNTVALSAAKLSVQIVCHNVYLNQPQHSHTVSDKWIPLPGSGVEHELWVYLGKIGEHIKRRVTQDLWVVSAENLPFCKANFAIFRNVCLRRT